MPHPRRHALAEKDAQDLKYFKLLRPFRERLHDAGIQRDRAGSRKLLFDNYGALILLYFFNPILTSLYGPPRAAAEAMPLCSVESRPVSQVTEDFLAWPCRQFAAEGKKVFVLVWDNASWHVGKRVRCRIGGHNRKVKRQHGDSDPR